MIAGCRYGRMATVFLAYRYVSHGEQMMAHSYRYVARVNIVHLVKEERNIFSATGLEVVEMCGSLHCRKLEVVLEGADMPIELMTSK
jgi:hypothetical protein